MAKSVSGSRFRVVEKMLTAVVETDPVGVGPVGVEPVGVEPREVEPREVEPAPVLDVLPPADGEVVALPCPGSTVLPFSSTVTVVRTEEMTVSIKVTVDW